MARSTITSDEAIDLLWRKGLLHWKLDSTQKELYECFHNAKNKITVFGASRRVGKSYLLCLIAIEACIKRSNTIVKFAAPKQKDVRSIIRPLIRQITSDCPDDLKPEFKTQETLYRFPNGSEIQLAGTDNGRAESIRGGESHLCIVDEAGFCDDLSYVVKSILLPTTTTTKGKIILASTPPKSAAHDFVKFMREAEYKGSFVKKTIFDNPRLSKDDIDEIIREYGGTDNVDFQREYLVKVITDENYAIVPEFTEELQDRIVREWPRPPFYDCYVSMDLGFKDFTVVLFAYFDFKSNKLIIEDEYVINGQKMTTDKLATSIKIKEAVIFKDQITGEQREPHLRVSDNNLIVINDLYQLHGLLFSPTRKDEADAARNQMRMLLAQERIIINPKCKTLIMHLKTGVWNKSKKSYERSPDGSHADAVDSLIYLVRNVQFTKNPYPSNFGMGSMFDRFQMRKDSKVDGAVSQGIQKMLNIKKQ